MGETFAGDAANRRIRPLAVIDAERGAAVVAEIELGCVAVKVRLGNVVIDACDPALENALDAEGGEPGISFPKAPVHWFRAASLRRGPRNDGFLGKAAAIPGSSPGRAGERRLRPGSCIWPRVLQGLADRIEVHARRRQNP